VGRFPIRPCMDLSRQYTLELGVALAAVPLLLGVSLGVGRLLTRRFNVPLGVRYRIAAVALSSFIPLKAYQLLVQHQFDAKTKGAGDVLVNGAAPSPAPYFFPEELFQFLLALGLLFGAFVAARLVRKYFWDGWFERTQSAEAPKFLADIGSACIIGFALLLIASGVYHMDLRGLQLGSTVSVAVLGFASQDLLGNLLSGAALQIGSPFRRGDWLLIDGRRLQVQEVNWRSTRMRSSDNVMVDIPNKAIAGGTIVNLSAPTTERATTVVVGFEHDTSPDRVKECLLRAACGAPGVLKEPSPRALIKNFGESAIHYEVMFWVAGEEVLMEATDAVHSAIWHEAKRNNLTMPYPVRTLQIQQNESPVRLPLPPS